MLYTPDDKEDPHANTGKQEEPSLAIEGYQQQTRTDGN